MLSPAGHLLHSARLRAGLSQAELARRAGTSQPALSAYEQGRKDPSVATLARLLAVTGMRLASEAGPSTVREYLRDGDGLPAGLLLDDVARLAARVTRGEDVWFALRELLDGVGLCVEVGDLDRLGNLLRREPQPTGSERVDALLAAVAEHLAVVHGVARPPWVIRPERFLARWWFPHRRRAFDAMALRDAPAAFRRRGIFLHPSALERV